MTHDANHNEPEPAQVLDPTTRRQQQRAWYAYDWANSAYWTSTVTVLISPYLISVATKDACPNLTAGTTCTTRLSLLGLPVAPGALPGILISIGTVVAFFTLPIVGALADRSPAPKRLLGWLAGIGATAASLMFFISGSNWQLGAVLMLVANLALMLAQAVYDAILVQISTPEERDRVSSVGWALGYLGGFILLALNLVVVTGAQNGWLPISQELAVRISLLSAGLWWGLFSIYPIVALHNRPISPLSQVDDQRSTWSTVRGSFTQLIATLRHLIGYKQTLLFLLAYLIYNDGIQTVITSSSTYASHELGFDNSQLIQVILMVQFVAFCGAMAFGRIAAGVGASKTIFLGLGGWLVVVVAAWVTPPGNFAAFLAIATGIGVVLGGTQALSRSLYSQLIPVGREAEYFGLYQAGERGTSWSGQLVFSLVFQFTGSYRPALISLMAFFIVGGVLLSRVKIRAGIEAAGHTPPAKV